MAGQRELYRSREPETQGILISTLPFTWDEIVFFSSKEQYAFGRSIEQAKLYKNHTDKVTSEWDSIDSYCKHKFLNFPSCKKDLQGKMYFSVASDAKWGGPTTVMSVNEFPYYLEPGIEHKIVWSISELTPEQYKHRVIENYPETDWDIVVFENSLGLKSVKTVFHVQVLLRKKTTF